MSAGVSSRVPYSDMLPSEPWKYVLFQHHDVLDASSIKSVHFTWYDTKARLVSPSQSLYDGLQARAHRLALYSRSG